MPLYNFVKRHKLIGTFAGIIGLILFCVITIKVFFFPVDISTGAVAAYSAFLGTGLTGIFMLWKEVRDKNDSSS